MSNKSKNIQKKKKKEKKARKAENAPKYIHCVPLSSSGGGEKEKKNPLFLTKMGGYGFILFYFRSTGQYYIPTYQTEHI